MSDPNIIGKVLFEWDGQLAEAVLRRDGTWTSPDATITDCLDTSYGLRDWSQGDGMPGYKQLREAAGWLGGHVEAPELDEPGPAGVVF